MGSIYQLIFFLAIALIAIVVTVFVLAVSLLGRAVRLSAQEQIGAEKKRKKDTENEIKKIQDKLEKAKAAGRVDIEALWRSLRDLERKDTKHKWKLRWIKAKPKLLTASWGALIPGAFFLISIIFIALALYRLDVASMASLYMWIALIALGIGIGFVCLTLKVIEGVAITSEETAFMREAQVFKTVLREFEEEKKLKVELIFTERRPPFHVGAGSVITIQFDLRIVSGVEAINPVVYFHAPPGFDFLETETFKQSSHSSLPNYISTTITTVDVHRGIQSPGSLVIKAPMESNSFTIFYRITSTGFSSDRREFEVIVE